MTVHEILPLMDQLPHADKLQLMQILLRQIATEEGIDLNASAISRRDKVRIQDLVPRQVSVFTPLPRDRIYVGKP